MANKHNQATDDASFSAENGYSGGMQEPFQGGNAGSNPAGDAEQNASDPNPCSNYVAARHKADGSRTAEFHAWCNMKQRCMNPRHRDYPHYGGRGIKVCQRWIDSFDAFVADVGTRPSKRHSIDRIDNARGYEPGNVRWATAAQQQRNRRQNRMITMDGKTMCATDWAKLVGIPANTVLRRLRDGWSAEDALSKPAAGVKRSGGPDGRTLRWRKG